MFNLIISIIAIALVVALAGASLYYGGDAFSKGSEEAKAATYVNQAQQIQAAATLYRASEGSKPQDMDALTSNGYLASEPKVALGTDGTWALDADNIFVVQALFDTSKSGLTDGVCEAVNASGAGVVFCIDGADGSDAAAAIATPAPHDAATSTHAVVYMAL